MHNHGSKKIVISGKSSDNTKRTFFQLHRACIRLLMPFMLFSQAKAERNSLPPKGRQGISLVAGILLQIRIDPDLICGNRKQGLIRGKLKISRRKRNTPTAGSGIAFFNFSIGI